jgi:hypothetical protein
MSNDEDVSAIRQPRAGRGALIEHYARLPPHGRRLERTPASFSTVSSAHDAHDRRVRHGTSA